MKKLFQIILLTAWIPLFATEDETFMELGGQSGFSTTDLYQTPTFGGFLGIQKGINERTDFSFQVGYLTGRPEETGMDIAAYHDLNVSIASFFTPFFGVIRPQFGGSIGGGYRYSESLDDFALIFGFHLRGLFDASDRTNYYLELNPKYGIGSDSYFDAPVRLGVQFLLGD